MATKTFAIFQLFGLLLAISIAYFNPQSVNISPLFDKTSYCPAANYIDTLDHNKTQYILHDSEFRDFAIKRFSRAIQIDTIVDESLKDFSKFIKFHDYLKREFPIIFEKAKVTTINEYGLLFEFIGEDLDLKPVLFMAHQDTVPIGDISDWVEDPLGGKFDDEKIYGRGTNDVKGLLVGLMGAMDAIYKSNPNHKFQRTVLFAFGYDEEISGNLGAKHIGEYLFQKYGPKSIDHILDEGAPMFLDLNNNYLGLLVTTEKGYRDLVIEVNTPGGHSSNPRDTTAIGVLSNILSSYEKEKFEAKLPNDNPMLNMFECIGEHGNVSKITKYITRLARKNPIAKSFLMGKLTKVPLFEYTVRTSQAIDVITGGDKFNSLPRNATAVINHRITIGDDFKTITDKAINHAKPFALTANLGLLLNGIEILPPTKQGVIKISSFVESDFPVSPITPVYDEIWFRLASYMKTFYEKEVYPGKFENKEYIIAPTTMQGNTDTKHYWKLTNHIFRSQPGMTNLFEAGMHGTNEYVHIETHLQVIAFYYNYILGIC